MSEMVVQNISLEGANDEAIEDAASRIYEASRLRPRNIANNFQDGIVKRKSRTILSPPPDNRDDKSHSMSAFNGECSTGSSSISDDYSDEDDIESSILYLEEKKLILKKAKVHQEREKAYIALNAHNIVNGRELSSRRSWSSSIWSEAKAMIEAFKVDAVGGNRIEEEECEFGSSMTHEVEPRASTSSDSSHDLSSDSKSSMSSSEPHRRCGIRNRKRRKIDISVVKLISSTEFEKERVEDELEVTPCEDTVNIKTGFSPTIRLQQASEMQLSMDSRKWISQAVLKQILVLSNAAISEHRRSLTGTGKRE